MYEWERVRRKLCCCCCFFIQKTGHLSLHVRNRRIHSHWNNQDCDQVCLFVCFLILLCYWWITEVTQVMPISLFSFFSFFKFKISKNSVTRLLSSFFLTKCFMSFKSRKKKEMGSENFKFLHFFISKRRHFKLYFQEELIFLSLCENHNNEQKKKLTWIEFHHNVVLKTTTTTNKHSLHTHNIKHLSHISKKKELLWHAHQWCEQFLISWIFIWILK